MKGVHTKQLGTLCSLLLLMGSVCAQSPIRLVGELSPIAGEGRKPTEQALAELDSQLTLQDYDANRLSWRLGVEYALCEHLSLDFGWLDAGEVSMQVTGQTQDPEALARLIAKQHPISGEGVYGGASWHHAINPTWALQVQLGVWFWQDEHDVQLNNSHLTRIEHSGEDLMMAVKFGYQLYDGLSVQGGIRMLSADQMDDPTVTVGVGYRF